MILIFDLDDTLYPESSYAYSGLRAVATHLEAEAGVSFDRAMYLMGREMELNGRGRVFDETLKSLSWYSRKHVTRCLSIYRSHAPDISLYSYTERVLDTLSTYPLYVVTDGNKLVQQRKVTALRLEKRFRKVYITHRYGVRHAKPSTYCFDRIRRSEGAEWKNMVYVGDDPGKDFVGLNAMGAKTVRVLTGTHRNKNPLPRSRGTVLAG